MTDTGARIVQVQYDDLDHIAQTLERLASANESYLIRAAAQASELCRGWHGEAALAFENEFQTQVLPAMQRLSNALAQGQANVSLICATFSKGESAAASLF